MKAMENIVGFIEPMRQCTQDYIVSINNVRIRVCINTEDILQYVLPDKTYWKIDPVKAEQFEYTLNILMTDSLSKQYVLHLDNHENLQKISKTEANCPNRQYVMGDMIIKLYQYPNHSVHIETAIHNSITVIAGNKYVLVFYLKYYIKEIVSKLSKLPQLHASAVAKNNSAIVFLGSGNTGKSTIAYNLTLYGWDMLHDDLVFVEKQRDVVCVHGIQVNPCLRRAGLPYVFNADTIFDSKDIFENKYHACFYLRNKILIKDSIPLKAVFLLSECDFAIGIPTAITTNSRCLLQSYISDSVCLKLIENISVYGFNKNTALKQIIPFLDMLINI